MLNNVLRNVQSHNKKLELLKKKDSEIEYETKSKEIISKK